MADVTGARGTLNINQDQRKIDMADRILLLEPDAAPLTVFTKNLSKKRAKSPLFKWMDDELSDRFDAINAGAGYTDAATALVVDTGTLFAVDDLVYVTRTGEVFRVDSIATNTLTVERGIGGGAAALVDNDELLITGSSREEGADARAARSDNPTTYTNYTQIESRTVDMTKTARASENEASPHDWNLQRKKAGIEHLKDIEYAGLFGKPSEDTSGTHAERTTGGFHHYVTTNETAAGGALTETEFFTALRTTFRYGSKVKLGLASGLVVDVLNAFPRGKLETRQDDTTYGVRVMRYVSPHGTLNVTTHWLLEGTEYGGYLDIVDLSNVSYRYLQNDMENRDTHVNENIQDRKTDARKDEWLTEFGFEIRMERTHGFISGVSS